MFRFGDMRKESESKYTRETESNPWFVLSTCDDDQEFEEIEFEMKVLLLVMLLVMMETKNKNKTKKRRTTSTRPRETRERREAYTDEMIDFFSCIVLMRYVCM